MRFADLIGMAVLSVIVCLTAVVQAGTVTHHYEFSAPQVIESNDGAKIIMEGTRPLGHPGEPLLPMFGVKLLVPPGEEVVGVEVIVGSEVQIPGSYFVVPAQREYPLSYVGSYEPVGPAPEIYGQDNRFPATAITHYQTQFYRGYSIGYASLSPVVYYPESGRLSYYSDIEVVFRTEATSRASAAVSAMLRSDEGTRSAVSRKVDNSLAEVLYPTVDETRVIPWDYVIITNEALDSCFQELAEFKNRRGVKTMIETVENISVGYPGIDLQDKIRNFIIDAYGTWGIDYVLLAGDVEILPHRGLYAEAYFYSDDDIPGDIYYGGLDGNWNDDGDNLWGETGEADLEPEVAVGRAAVDSPGEVSNFLYKQIMYQRDPVVSECNHGLFTGELLWDDVYCQWTFGKTYLEEVRLGSSNHGYTTVGFPVYFQYATMYDLDICPAEWSAMNDLRPLMNAGTNLLSHLGHCNTTYALRFYNSDVTDVNFTNNGVNHGFYTIYSQGCYGASFDNRTSGGSYVDDCVAERFTTLQHAAVCYVGNSRYGWGEHQSTNGSSQYFHRQFFDAVFGEDITRIGPANDDSKVDNIWSISYGANRWCYYELNVLGDPELDFWTNVPQELTPTYPVAYVIGQDTLHVMVPSVEGAVVALTFDSDLVGRGVTDVSGQADVVLDAPPDEPGIMTMVITAHDYLEYIDDIQVIPPSGPYVLYRSHTLDDSAGNNNGLLDFGEEVDLTITVENVGNDDVTGVTVTLDCDDPYVTVTDDEEYYGTILSQAQASVPDGFALLAASNVPDGHVVVLHMTATSDSMEQWDDDFGIVCHAPVLSMLSFEIDDATGNGNERLDPGETATVDITLENDGTADLENITGVLASDFSYIIIDQDTATMALLPSSGSGTLAPCYGVSVSMTASSFSRAVFYLGVDGIRDYANSLLHELTVGGYYVDVEHGAEQWTHAFLTPGFSDQWHISSEDCHSETHAWKCGDTGTGSYNNLLDAVLVSPSITIPEYTELRFWHWMEGEASGYYPDSAYDGGTVEISVNGGAWEILTPSGGYTHNIRYSAGGGNPYTGPFPGGTPCFSGNIDWGEVVCNLSSYSGDIQIRFRFGSDQAVNGEGWYVDDIEIVLTEDLAPPEDLEGILDRTFVILSWHSPGVGDRCLEGYNIYRNSNLIASGIQALGYQDDLTGMPEGTYVYAATAVYETGESGFSNPVTIDFTQVLEAVDDLVVEVLDSDVILRWSPSMGATSYNVYRGTDPSAEPGDMTLIGSTDFNTYTDPGIVSGSERALFYVVTATD